ncbi:hypothetical protein [Luedemannella helvata]|uniref:Uncharacterized protein n=1 Tax=Luedemannella helvata TaxID=349315 RepID=A0ABN2KFU5_9ACTN
MSAYTVDPAAMRVAIPAVQALMALLDGAASDLAGVSAPAGVPGPVAARVAQVAGSVSADLRRASRDLASLPDDLLRRISAAQVANAPWATAASFGLPALGFYARSFTAQSLSRSLAAGLAAREVAAGLRAGQSYGGGGPRGTWNAFRASSAAARAATANPRGLPPGLGRAASVAGRGLTFVGWGVTAAQNATNPHLSTTQKVTRTAVSIGAGTGASVLGGAAAAAMVGGTAAGPVGAVAAFGAAVAWNALDNKFHVTDKVGDAAADAVDAVGGAAGDAGKAVGGAASDAANEVADGVSSVAGGAKSAAKKALGVIGL